MQTEGVECVGVAEGLSKEGGSKALVGKFRSLPHTPIGEPPNSPAHFLGVQVSRASLSRRAFEKWEEKSVEIYLLEFNEHN